MSFKLELPPHLADKTVYYGIRFRSGVAEVDDLGPNTKTALEHAGVAIYEFTMQQAVETEAEPTLVSQLDDLTVSELREIAHRENITLTGTRKSEIIQEILDYFAATAEFPEDDVES